MGGDISVRTDVYSLGVMLYEMIAGKVPCDRRGGMSTLVAHVNEAAAPAAACNPRRLGLPPRWRAIVIPLPRRRSPRSASPR